MYKLVIIDDEYDHVHGIKDYIEWEKYGIEVSGVAYNGKDGLELIERLRPDIALIDIQMPFINGLALIEEVKKLGQNVQMIIMSGHDNFDYARKAISLQANNYLLKPCSAEEIVQAVLRAKNMALDEANKKSILNSYHTLFDQYQALFKEKLLADLLEYRLRNSNTFFDDIRNYHIGLSDNTCIVAVFRLEDRDNLYAQNTNEEFDYLLIRMADAINRSRSESFQFELVMKDNDLVLIACNPTLDEDDFQSRLTPIYQALSDTLEYSLIVGIGKPADTPLNASKSYKEALAALEHHQYQGGSKLSVFNHTMLEEGFHFLYPFHEEEKLFNAVEMGDASMAEAALSDLFRRFAQDTCVSINFIRKVGLTLLNSLMRFCSDKNLNNQEIHKLIFKSFDDIMEAKSFENIAGNIQKTLRGVINSIHTQAPVNKLIQKAIHYIHQHYTEDISLKTVADELYISSAYLSFLFKQETKTNFVDYLNNHRILMAKELFKDVRLKNYEVAFQVGFQDEKYFFKLFKKYTGLTASQFRDSLRIFDTDERV